MAYRRRQQVGRADAPSTYNYDSAPPETSASSSSASSLATKAIRASSSFRDSSLSSVYEQSALSSPRASSPPSALDSSLYEHTSKDTNDESKQGFWEVLARKAKSMLDDDDDGDMVQQRETPGVAASKLSGRSKKGQYNNTYDYPESSRKTGSPALQKKLDAFASSLNHIGGTIGNALEEGIIAVENRTADIIQETRKIQIRKKNDSSRSQNQSNPDNLRQQHMAQTHVQPQMHTLETQLKTSRDVAMAMAAKAKLLLRELKTVKADLAFATERCAQLEEENRILRDSREKGGNPEDDDLIRLQLESLLAEKARLAQENSVYARENRCLREIVEYHQLTMQDVVYLDEGSEEVTEIYPTLANVQSSCTLSGVPPTTMVPTAAISQVTQNVDVANLFVQMPVAEVVRRH